MHCICIRGQLPSAIASPKLLEIGNKFAVTDEVNRRILAPLSEDATLWGKSALGMLILTGFDRSSKDQQCGEGSALELQSNTCREHIVKCF
jgi:hypothetical protein